MDAAKTWPKTAGLLALVALLSCVTINIYFPAEEVQKAAEEIVGDIRQSKDQSGAVQEGVAGKTSNLLHCLRTMYSAVSVESAHAQGETAVSNAAIRAIKDRIKSRQASLGPFYDQGVVGENSQGYLTLLNPGGLASKSRADAQRLVQAENSDRRQLYGEVAKALNVDSNQVNRIAQIFADEWKKSARPGWMIQNAGGQWTKK